MLYWCNIIIWHLKPNNSEDFIILIPRLLMDWKSKMYAVNVCQLDYEKVNILGLGLNYMNDEQQSGHLILMKFRNKA